MNLIKLHYKPEYIPEGHSDTFFINAAYIVSIVKYLDGTFVQTVADINSGNGYFVQETPEQIIKAIRLSKRTNPLSFDIERIREGKYTLEEIQ